MKMVKNLFSGGGKERRQQITKDAEARAQQEALQAKQLQAEGQRQSELDSQLSKARRAPRGRRLLLAAETGEAGVKKTLG